MSTSSEDFAKQIEAPYKIIKGNKRNTVTLYLEDCNIGMKNHLQEASIDVVVTSPPYNIGIGYATHKDDLPREDYLKWMGETGVSIKRVLKDCGSFFLNIGNTPRDQWIAWDVAQKMRKYFVLQNVLHWVKSIAINKADVGNYTNIAGDVAVGHFKPIVSDRFVNDCHEYIFHFTKTGDTKLSKLAVGVPYQDKTNIGRWKIAKEDKRDRGNTWFIPYETIQNHNERPHPATFPVRLPEMCIKLHGIRANMLVMDPFLGIGSTAIASLKMGASFVGFEIDNGYMAESIARLSSSIDAFV